MPFRWGSFSSVFLRCALGLGFLSAVADRFGLWGAFGQPNVEWGTFSRFLEYTHSLNWYLPEEMIPPLGVIATCAETLFGLLLLVGWQTRATALLSGLLLLSFAVSMTLALGVKAPLNFAVFTGVGGALLLANCGSFPFSVDDLLSRRAIQKRTDEPHRATVYAWSLRVFSGSHHLRAQQASTVDTSVIARTATDQGAYHYAQVFQQRGRWIYPDVGYIDFNHAGEYREVWVGGGGVLFDTSHLTVIGEGYIDKSLGSASGGALYLQPWMLVAYSLAKLGGQVVYFPYLPLNDAGRVQHVLERAKLEYDVGRFKLGGGYAGYRFGDGDWQSKPFVAATIKAGPVGALELWLQHLPGNRWTVQVRYQKSFHQPG